MKTNDASISRSAITKLLLATAVLLGLLGLFVIAAQGASAGSDLKVTVNSTANTDDGDCEGAPNDGSGTCTLREAINEVNAGNADLINFHPPVFSKEQPGVINLCNEDTGGPLLGDLPWIERDVVIDSKDSGVILDGGAKDGDCIIPGFNGIVASAQTNGLDFTLNGGKNFTIRDTECESPSGGVTVTGFEAGDYSLGTIEITGISVENVCGEGVLIEGTNLESGSITNSDISSNYRNGVNVQVYACDADCELEDSVLDISGNRIQSGKEDIGWNGVNVNYSGRLNSKLTLSVSQNEAIHGSGNGVRITFDGCGTDSGINVHVDENDDITGARWDGVDIDINGNGCYLAGATAGSVPVDPGDTSDHLDVVVTVNGNGDVETEGLGDSEHAVRVGIFTCCNESDSSASVEVNDNGRLTGEDDGVGINTWICCGDDNSTNVSVNNNDEITGEGDDGISVHSFAGSSTAAEGAGVAGVSFDADDNTCTITVDGNNEIDGVGSETSHGTGVGLNCFAGALGTGGRGGESVAGGPRSSGDGNVSTISVTNNNDIDGDTDGIDIEGLSGSINGEADNNTFTATVSGNGEVTGDDDDGIDIDIGAGTDIEEGDDNFAEIIIEENQEVGGNGDNGMDLDIFAGGITDGSEDNATAITIVQNGDIEGSGSSGDGINIDSSVCCDSANTNTITINNNKGEITGHDSDGIDIDTCCSVNIITIMDNEGNIRGGDSDGLDIDICDTGIQVDFWTPDKFAGGGPVGFADCLKRDVTHLTVTNNSFSDSENDGINITGGTFEDDDIKSVISNNIIEGNGDDGIDINSANGLNIGPGNEIFDNGTEDIDAGIEIDWWLATCEWDGNKFPANHNTITQNSIHGNFGLGIDLVGFDDGGDNFGCDDIPLAEGEAGCDIFPPTAIAPNDCIPFPDLQTQSGDKLIGTACSLCTVEVFVADGGEGTLYLVSGEADEDGNFSIELPCDLGPADLTATATDKLKNTSEFSETIVTLGTGSCATDTPEPTETPVPPDETDTPVPADPTATPEPAKLCGDPNVDGSVNSIDATVILQLKAAMIDSLANESSADVNNSGSITSVDASLILQVTAGLIGEGALSCPA